MHISKYLQNLLTAEITRKEFLSYLGIFMLTITGVSGLLRSVTNIKITDQFTPKQGYGTGPYGV
jgi:hypothetical protein